MVPKERERMNYWFTVPVYQSKSKEIGDALIDTVMSNIVYKTI